MMASSPKYIKYVYVLVHCRFRVRTEQTLAGVQSLLLLLLLDSFGRARCVGAFALLCVSITSGSAPRRSRVVRALTLRLREPFIAGGVLFGAT